MADIITYPEDGIRYDAEDASGYLSTRLSGVYSAEEDFAVTAQGGLSVQVSAGQAWVRPARFKGRSIIPAGGRCAERQPAPAGLHRHGAGSRHHHPERGQRHHPHHPAGHAHMAQDLRRTYGRYHYLPRRRHPI